MIKQFLRKKKKVAYGMLNTYIRRRGRNYCDAEWFYSYYMEGISDRQTIKQTQNPLSAQYHYNSVEMHILKHLHNNKVSLNPSMVLDIGSGAGHWIDFYRSLGSSTIDGVDVSLSAINYLQGKYIENPGVVIYHGKASEILDKLDKNYDLVNAIGVMFHIVDDVEWAHTIKAIGTSLRKDGLFIVGGHFGILDGLNVQIDSNNQINKRLRSKRHWRDALKKAGFSRVDFYTNTAYLWIDDSLPENNVLIATK